MATFTRDMVDLLSLAGLGTEGADLFEGSLPSPDDFPGAVLAVSDYSGRGVALTFDMVGIDYPRLSLFFRDQPNEYDAPIARAYQVFEWIKTHFGHVINGHYYPALVALGTPAKIGNADAEGRWTIGFNVEVTRNA